MLIYPDDVYKFSIASKGAYVIYFVFYMTLCWISTRRTKIVAGRSRHSVSFLNENPRVKRRSRHLVSIFNQNPRLTLRSRHPDFFFRTEIRFPRYRRGGRSGHVLFWGYKRQEHASKTRAKREKHASLPGRRLHSSGTLLPFSYGIKIIYLQVRCQDSIEDGLNNFDITVPVMSGT